MNDHKLEVEKREKSPVNKSKVAKNATRKANKLKLGRRPDPATERMIFRLTPAEKSEIEALAIESNRTYSNYVRDVMLKHLASVAPPKK